jgi:branched-chain amino acid transport system permease protein
MVDSARPTHAKAWGLGLALVAAMFLLPSFAPRFYVYLAALILVRGLLATSLNLVLGYGGMYQFHHTVDRKSVV